MTDADKKEFMLMMRIVCSSFNHAEFDKETLRYWFGKLDRFDLKTVSHAFDVWIDSSKYMPTVKDILDNCKPVTPIYTAIERKADKEANKKHAHELAKAAHETFKQKRDMKAWARKILNNVSAYPDISVRYAKEALNGE